jgi:hypothetical protein
MKNILAAIIGALLLVGSVYADSVVIPASCTFTNFREEVSGNYVSSTTFYQAQTLCFTNCVLFDSTITNGLLYQGLTNVQVKVNIGAGAGVSNTYTGTVNTTASPNVWNLTIASFPTNWTTPNVQVQITDANTNTYVYPWKQLGTKAAM